MEASLLHLLAEEHQRAMTYKQQAENLAAQLKALRAEMENQKEAAKKPARK